MPSSRGSRPLILFRRFYDWTLSWAETPYAIWALFFLAVAESSFFPVPPDVLLIALAIAIPPRSFSYALVCSVGSILGGVIGYYIGAFFMQVVGCPIVSFFNGEAIFDSLAIAFNAHSFWAIFVAAVTPIPYKIFTIAAGALDIDFMTFLWASIVGRPLRFFAVALLIFLFGRPVKAFIEKNFNWLSFVFAFLLIGGFALVKTAANHDGEPKEPTETHSSFASICGGFR